MCNTSFFVVLPFLLLCLFTASEIEATNDTRFTTINTTSGLSNNSVNEIVKDQLGFIWIATNDGLCRYDGYHRIKVFKTDPEGLQSSNIRALHVDSKNNLWVGTRLGGLSRYDIEKDSWTTFLHEEENANSISNDEVLSILEDRKGRIWVGTENGLNVFDTEKETFHRFSTAENGGFFKGTAILSIIEDDKGWIWIGTWSEGFYLALQENNESLEGMQFRQFDSIGGMHNLNVWELFQDDEKRYWLGAYGQGLFRMDIPLNASNLKSDQGWQPTFLNIKHDREDPNSLSNNRVQDIIQHSNGDLWIATAYGLNVLKKESLDQMPFQVNMQEEYDLTFQHNYFDHSEEFSLANSNVNCLLKDDNGLVWVGTISGVSKYNWYTSQFQSYDFEALLDFKPHITDIYVDQNNIVWVCSDQHRLIFYDLNNNKLVSLIDQDKHPILSRLFVSTIYDPGSDYLYLGTDEGLVKINKKTYEFKNIPTPKEIKKLFPDFLITHIYKDQKDNIWLGFKQGVILANEDTGTFKIFCADKLNPLSLSDNSITDIIEDVKGNLWISTFNGLNQLQYDTDGNIYFKTYFHQSDFPSTSLPVNQITALLSDDRFLYIGTSAGMCRYNLADEVFENLSKEGQKFNVTSIEKSSDGNIWGGATEGIFFLDINNLDVNLYEKADGLADITFMRGASSVDQFGNISFACHGGMTRIPACQIQKNTTPPNVLITEAKLIGADQSRSFSTIGKDKIVLFHDDYYAALSYTALNYNRPEKNVYQYRLQGFDEGWNYTNAPVPAVYTNLEPGEYIFEVKAANNDGVWNATPARITVQVLPAFWETAWFRFVLLVFLAGCLLLWLQIYTSRMYRKNDTLQKYNAKLNAEIQERKRVEAALHEREHYMEKLVKERTRQLEIKNEENNKLLESIKNRNEELEKIVEKRTKNLQESNDELMRSNEDLEQFAYIASHDLQEPLRIISNFVGLLGRKYKDQLDERAFEYIHFAEDAAKRMSKLIKSILTYSRVDKKELDLNNADLNLSLEAKIMDLSQKIEERNAKVTFDEIPTIFCEKSQIAMVFYNLINNAIKFNKNDKPTVHIGYSDNGPNGQHLFSVKDNGIGIAPQYQQKIFEIFRRLHSNQEYEGTGIGLALCQKIIVRHGGRIWLTSEEGKGTTFYFTISKQLKSQNMHAKNAFKVN